jgi:2-keto-4-pentenoate hydratase/2-oxohepta-3-ene-1,7-dioic acid hydratase in catechol pathway
MKLASFLHPATGQTHAGRLSADDTQVHPYPAGVSVLDLVARHAAGEALPEPGEALPLASVRLLAPIPQPRRNVWCVGRNYHAHAKELRESVFKGMNQDVQTWPIVFTKVPECVVAPGAPVQLPQSLSGQIDYEAELAVIIGRGGKNIAKADAMSHVFGYTALNDVTARDVQMRHTQWDLGKSFDTFCPMGPWIVTADELDGQDTRVRCWINGELRQDARTTDLIFDLPTLIETISRGITLLPGDIIATGTPAGVGMGLSPPVWLQPGDAMRVEIDGIGTLENTCVGESA